MTGRTWKRIAACWLAGGWLGALAAGSPATNKAQPAAPAGRTSYHAARADALGKLVERAGALKLGGGTTVKALLAGSPATADALTAYLSCLGDAREPNFAADGSCTLELAVTPRQLADGLAFAHARAYKGTEIKASDVEQLPVINEDKALRARGAGAVRGEFAEPQTVATSDEARPTLSPAAAKFWADHCRTGGRRSTQRAARDLALTLLAEQLRGVHVTPETTLKDFLLTSDDPNVDVRTFLKGARVTAVRCYADALVVEVDVQVQLRTVYASLRSWGKRHFKGSREKMTRLDELVIRAENAVVRAMGMAVPADADLVAATPRIRRAVAMARAAPGWAGRSLKAVGAAPADGSGKASPRAAEAHARLELAAKLRRLPVGDGTVGALAATNERLAEALAVFQQSARAVGPAPSTGPADEVRTAVEVKLKGLWNALLRCRK